MKNDFISSLDPFSKRAKTVLDLSNLIDNTYLVICLARTCTSLQQVRKAELIEIVITIIT
jgi:hypothetical protein